MRLSASSLQFYCIVGFQLIRGESKLRTTQGKHSNNNDTKVKIKLKLTVTEKSIGKTGLKLYSECFYVRYIF